MYSYFSGKILMIDGIILTLHIENTGLGFDIFCAPSLLSAAKIGETLSLWIHHHKTDVSESLFGFSSFDERSLFRELNKVNGVGGKTALALLGLGADELIKAIHLEDDILLSSVPGIGKKTAQKIIVDLKGSINFAKAQETKSKKTMPQNNTTLISSLVQMGFDKTRVEEIVDTLDPNLSLEEKVREAIRKIK